METRKRISAMKVILTPKTPATEGKLRKRAPLVLGTAQGAGVEEREPKPRDCVGGVLLCLYTPHSQGR